MPTAEAAVEQALNSVTLHALAHYKINICRRDFVKPDLKD